jgi:shikimate kinase
MAGCGKSDIGRMVAGKLSRDFVDTDTLIEQAVGCPLQEVLDSKGVLVFRSIEEDILLGINLSNSVIATGGSSIYSHAGMMHLKQDGHVIMLEVELAILEKRISNFESRGLVKRPEQSFAEIFIERRLLYKKYADTTIVCSDMDREEVCNAIIAHCVPPVQ